MGLNVIEAAAIEVARAAPMLAQVERWVAVNSGTRNLTGLATMANLLADAFSALPGDLTLVDPAPVEMVDTSGTVQSLAHGRHLHLRVRPEAPVALEDEQQLEGPDGLKARSDESQQIVGRTRHLLPGGARAGHGGCW